MPYSMTGFGRAEKIFATRKYSVELKSVNSRYCDLNIRMPRLFNFADASVRKQITDSLTRGKVDVFINYQDTASESETVTVNEGLVKAYSDAAASIAGITGRTDDLGVARLASYPDVLQVSQTSVDEDMLGAELSETVAEALNAMKAMRKREGDALAENILTKIATLADIRDEIEERSPAVIDGYRTKLSARVDELLTSEQKEFYDESRLAAEVALFADKCAVDEELTSQSYIVPGLGDGFPRAGDQPRDQHLRFEGKRHRDHQPRASDEEHGRRDKGADPESGLIYGRVH